MFGYCKTPLISMGVFSGLATVQVLIFGGYDKADWKKTCKEGVCSFQCFPQTTRSCACFSDHAHTSGIQGYLYWGGGGGGGRTFGALQPTGNYLLGFTVFWTGYWVVTRYGRWTRYRVQQFNENSQKNGDLSYRGHSPNAGAKVLDQTNNVEAESYQPLDGEKKDLEGVSYLQQNQAQYRQRTLINKQ